METLFNSNEDDEGIFTVPVFFELLHELLSHKKIRMNDYLISIHTKYVRKGKMEIVSPENY